jgi:hypothetical protein
VAGDDDAVLQEPWGVVAPDDASGDEDNVVKASSNSRMMKPGNNFYWDPARVVGWSLSITTETVFLEPDGSGADFAPPPRDAMSLTSG